MRPDRWLGQRLEARLGPWRAAVARLPAAWREAQAAGGPGRDGRRDLPATGRSGASSSAPTVDPSRTPRPGRPRTGRGRRWPRAAAHPAFTRPALLTAWRKVRAAGGGPGVDGEGIAAFEDRLDERLAELAGELAAGTYRPRPVRRVFVPKPSGGLRPLAIWALRDRVAQRVVLDHIEPLFEPAFLDASHGYRPGRSVDTAVRAVLAARDAGLRWVLDADIRDCFDRIDRSRLRAALAARVRDRAILRLVDAWLEAGVLGRDGATYPAGAAQGGVLSPLFCNITLHALDAEAARRGIRMVRYADDFVCFGRRRADAEAAGRFAAEVLAGLGLELNDAKTAVTHFDSGFAFLGVFFLRHEHFHLSPNRPHAGQRPGASRPAHRRPA